MKAFSFHSIFKNFSKITSLLAAKMPWRNLRVNLGSMSVLSRVNPLFSRTSFGASFGTSRRASHFAAMIFAVLVLSMANVGMAWGAESATNEPATVPYGTGGAAKTFLDVANTVSNCTISSGSVACVTYGLYEMDYHWRPKFYSGPKNGSSSSYNYANASTNGFMAGSSAGTGTAANKSATSGYGAAKYTSSAEAVIYVTGITGIAVMGKDNDTSSEKRLYIKVEEYAADGTCTDVGTTKSTYNKSLHITAFDAGTLSGTKYYKVTLTSGNTSSCETSQIRFTKYIAQPCTEPNLSYATTTITKTFGDEVFTNALTNTNGVAVTYSSTNENVATVADNGQVTIEGAGETTITASSAEQTVSGTLYCAAEASYTLTVNKANISPTLTYDNTDLAIGGTANPTINGNTGNGAVTYSSSNTDVATVDSNTGVVTAKAEGTATITATIAATANYNGGTATATITVNAAPEPETYSITYNGNHPTNAWNAAFAVKNIPAEQTLTGGTGTVSNNTPTITENESSEYAIYTFNNWNTAADGKGTSYAAGAAITITENTTLYAQWTPRTYNITYYDTDKTTELEDLEPKNYTYGTGVASLPTPTKDGYTFSSWTKWWDGGEESNVSSISNTTWGDANLAAQWTCAALTLVLDGDAATPAGGSPIGTEYTLTCSASTGAIASYQWKQNTTASTTGAVDAEGTGATTASFSPVPAAAGTYYYYCVATDACDNSVNTSFSGAFTFTAPADPCSEPAEVTNEIARFFVPCGLSNAISVEPSAWTVTNQDASTGDNTFTTSGFGGSSSNWYRNETSGLIYGKLSGNSSYILLKLKSGSFQAGDVVTAYFNRNDANKSGLTLKTQGSSYAITPAATAAGVETSGTYTLVADAIEADGSIKLFRANSSSYVNRIIVTRPACTNVSITTEPTTPVAATVGSACSITGLVAAGTSPTYQWYTCNSDGSSATAIDAAGTLSFTGYTTATLGLTPTATGATYYKCVVSGSCGVPVTSDVVTVNATAAASLTALVSGTRYDVADMVPNGTTISGTEQTLTGLSANTKFYLVGPTAMAVKNDAKTVDGIDFTNSYYFKNAATLSSNTPTDRAIKFILPGAGTLTAWVRQSAKVCLAKEGVVGTAFGSGNSETFGKYTLDVASAGTYYIYATGGSTTLYAVKFDATVACTTAPTVNAGSNSSVGSTTATVTCASGISSLGTGGCTITSYGFVLGTSANPTLSNTVHEVGTTYTTTGTSFSKDLTGLTASTTYYVRPYATNGYGTAYGTQTSFTTSAAEPDPLVTWTMNLNTSTWGAASTETSDGTNITSIATSQTAGDTGTSAAATAKTSVASAEVTDNSSPSNSANFTFTVNSAKKVVPEKVTCQVFNVGSAARNYKAQIIDNNGHVYNSTNTLNVTAEATLTDATFNFAAGGVLVGNVTLKVYAWGGGSYFRMGQHVKLFGEVQNAADYTVTHTLSNVTKSSGATSVKEGNTYTATYAASSGCTLPSTITVTIGGASKTVDTDYTWNSETGVVTIPGNKVTGNIVITVTGVAAESYSITYHCNGAESGCPANVAAATNLPSPLPSAPTKSGYTFGGWYTDEDLTVDAVAGAALTGNTTLYAKWTVNSSSECITIAYFDASQGSSSNNKPDANAKYLYGYTKSDKTPEYAYTLTTGSTNNKGQGTGASDYLRMDYGTTVTVYADNTTTGGTPASFENVTGVSVDFKMKNSSYYTSFDIYVGDTKIANNVSLSGAAQTAFTTFAYEGLAQLSGTVRIVNKGNVSSNYHFYVDNIEICTSSLDACTTPELSDLEDQIVCPGENVSWTAIVNNTEALQDGEMIAYQWNKKGNNTVLSSNATLTLNDITEAAGGTYVVTATVSADGKASKTATKEVTLTVRPATATPTITANANTIYKGNSVTLTATCASSGVGYQWYTCTDADGTNAQAIDGATNTTYTFTAGEAGTYYYKVIVTGDGTHSCGTAEEVYTLVISPAAGGDCETEIWVVKAADLPEGATAATHITTPFTGGSNESASITIDGNTYTITQRSSNATGPATIVVPEGNTATLYILVKGNNGRSVILEKGGVQQWTETPEDGWQALSVDNLAAGTYSLRSSNNLGWGLLALKLCSGSTCTDPEVIATVDNATVCEGTENVTFTANNYAVGAEFLWQKKDGNTWTNISGANSATYTISPVTTEHAGQYRVIATNDCSRTSEELTLTVLTAPEFNAFANTASVMKGNALTINDVEATNATDYTWYKSADNSFDVAADTKVGASKDLLLAASSITEEANQTFYLFCVASNSCGSVTSNAITVTVTPFIEEECATKGNEGEHEFKFTNTSCSEATLDAKKVWSTNSNSKYLTYTAPEGRYFAKAKVQVAHSSKTIAAYAYTTDGTNWTAVELTGLTTSLTTKEITFPENVTGFRIGRRFDDKGVGSGNFYLYEACFTYENACTPTSVTPTTTLFEYNMSVQMDFVEPTFTVKHGEEVVNDAVLTYTSSNPAIATVDEDGSVTFEGMTGTVTITAAYAGTTIDEIEYCASEGSYTITVGCQDQEPKIIAAAGTNLDGCNNSITLEAKMQDGTTAFTGGTYQWYRDGEAIEGATSASYEVVRAGTYTVSRTDACTKMSSNSAVVTNENPEPKVERLTPFQYYHVDKTYSNQMKDRHLFAVTSYGTLDGKRYHLTATRNGEALDLSSSTAFFTIPSSDNAVDTVMIDLNELKGKYSANDEIVITCAPINNCNQVSAITSSITIYVIDQTPTLALICSGSNKASGTRKTSELTVGGDFLTGYNVADLCQQTGNTSFDANTEWGFYTELKTKYIVTPVNGYAEFNKLNYEPFDILLLTDYPKASKSEAAATILDDMAALCDYRPLLSLKAHMVAKSPSKWAAKGFTTSPVVPAATSQYANIVCYAHPMFDELDDTQVEGIYHDNDDFNQLVYQILTGPGHESGKGLQGFELKDADNFVTIGLIHYNAAAEVVTHTDGDDTHTHIKWTPAANDRQLVAIAERQANIEARMILFAINCGAQSMQTPMGRQVLLTCLDYLLKTDPIQVADCRLTFDNGDGNTNWGKYDYEGTGTKGDGLWSTAANWGPDYLVVPGRNNDVRIAAPCTVDANNVEVLSVHITEDGSLTIPADKSLTARSTILRADEHGNVYPTNVADISLGSNAGGNASLILNNERGDTKAGVAMYSTAKADTENYSAAASTWQYIGTPHSDVQNAANNYYDSWLYQYDTGTEGWVVIPNGGPLVPFRGYCVTHPESPHTYWMEGTLVSTTNQDITIPANRFVVVANSWTAPIQINELTDDDMEGLTDKTIYFFNTGSDPNQEGELNKENGRYAAGTYVSVPIHSAPYTGDSYIPSMQGFYVVGGSADGTLHLDYERHVRAKRENVPSGPMHAPARITDTDNEPQVAKFLFRGTRYDDRLIILERPDFTRGYDSGWDGEQWGGNAAAPMSYVVTETRWDAVSAIPEYEGTVIAFRAGEDSEYTIHFDYDGMEEALYLLDTDTQIYTRVLKGNSYTFTCADKAEHNRFILTRKAPQIATGTENINTGENAKAVKFIKDDKIFIFVNGMLYDATGKMVIR